MTVLLVILTGVVGVLLIQNLPGQHPAHVQMPALDAEFRQQAKATIAAIERLQSFSGAPPQYEAQKALDDLDILANTFSEDNVMAIIATYHHAIRMATITGAKKELAELTRVRRDIWAIETNLR